jgi:Tol biopolymer transport system component
LGFRQFRQPAPESQVVRFTVSMPPKTTVDPFDTMAVSPDGRYLAFTANPGSGLPSNQLWLRPLDSTEIRPLPGTDSAHFPFWSPDSRYIGFWTVDGLKRVAVEGGPPASLVKTRPMGGTWSRSGFILIGNFEGPILQVSEAGGEAKPVLTLDKSRHETGQTWPQFLPDGNQFLYLSQAGAQSGIYLARVGSPESRKIADVEAQAAYSQGYFLFPTRPQGLMARPFNPASGKFTGEPFRVADNVGTMSPPGATSLPTGSLFSVSESGILAFRAGSSTDSIITVFNRRGERMGTAGPPGDYAQITLSPDEKRLAIDRRQNGSYDIWMLEMASGVFSRITFDSGNDRDPVFSADGRQIVFTNDRSGMPHIYRKTIGGGPDELIYRGPDREATEAWLKDGSILYGNLRGRKYFLLRPGETGEPKLIYQSEYTVDEPAISPDGKWVAYGSDESGRFEAYIARFPQWDERRQISTDGGMQPHWRQDGREIVYITQDGRILSVGLKTGASPEALPPAPLFNSNLRPNGALEQWTMSRDGSKFYVLSNVQEGEKPVTVVVNWLAGRK